MGAAGRTVLTAQHRQVVAGSEVLAPLSADVVDDLVARLEARSLDAGARLFVTPQGGHRLWVVLEGRVGVSNPRRQRLLAVLEAGDVLGEVQVFDPVPWRFSAAAMTPAVVASASRGDVLDWVGRHPSVSALLLERLARRLAGKSRAGRESLGADATVRLARGLLSLADRYTMEGVVRHGLTQQQLADIVGLSRERVNKALGEFTDRGWIDLARGTFTVLDRAALVALAGHVEVPEQAVATAS